MDKLTTRQALDLVFYMDEKLKRSDFKRTQMLGVDFGGYYNRATGRVTSGCSKVHCITSIVGYLCGDAFGPSTDDVGRWLDEKVPGWKKEIGIKEETTNG